VGNIALQLPPIVRYQADALWCTQRYGVVEGSTKSGKTYACLVWLLEQSVTCNTGAAQDQNVWWVAPVYKQAEIAFRRMCAMLRKGDPARQYWSRNKSERTIALSGSRKIWFKTADDPDNLYGDDVYAAVLDEASRMKADSWYAVRSTLTSTQGPVRIIGNVKGRKNWMYQLARKAQAGEPGMHYANITALDAVEAGLIEQSELDDARRLLPESVFNELYLNKASDDGSNPFGIEYIAKSVRPMSNRPPVAWGVDLAKTQDWTVVVGLDAQGEVAYFDRWQGVKWDQTEERIAAAVKDGNGYVDATGVGDPIAERLQRKCPKLEAFKIGANKQSLIEGLIVDIQQGKVHPCEGVMRAELESFEYSLSRSQRVLYSAPSGMHDDCVIALAFASLKLSRAVESVPPMIEMVDVESDSQPTRNRMEALSGVTSRVTRKWSF